MTHPKSTRIPRTCRTCGAEFHVFPSALKRGPRLFCSLACREKARLAHRIEKTCPVCGTTFSVIPTDASRRLCCSIRCKSIHKRAAEHIYNGYVWVYRDGKPVAEHRTIMETLIGRPLRSDEDVHHIDENRGNNDPANLQLLTHAEHISLHSRCNRWARESDCCAECDTTSRPHRSKGLCKRCYERDLYHRRHGHHLERTR